MATMADENELKHMVMHFRVSELQVLLGYAGRSKSGRKQELLGKAIQLVQNGCPTSIQMKICELYRRRFPGKGSGPPSGGSTSSTLSGLGTFVVGRGDPPKFRKHFKYQQQERSTGGLPLDYSIPNYGGSTSPASSMPIHPDVQLKRLPFYDIMAELLKPSTLVPKGQSRYQEMQLVFHFTPQQAQSIAMSHDFRASSTEYTVQVQLRFCMLETSCPQEDNFPPSICVRINNKMAALPNPIPTNKPGVEPKRPSRPVNITSLCRLSPTVPNHVSISWAAEYGRGYCAAVYMVQKLCSDTLLQRLKQKGVRHPDHSRALIKEKLATDPDSEVATTSLRVSLNCPLGKMKMNIPCRASTCNHLQCFDASTFLQMNEKKPTWICPVCDKPAEFDSLVIDGYFTEILKQAPETTEIQFTDDGNWHVWKPKEAQTEEINTSQIIQAVPDSPKKEDIVIDLTESDDEEVKQAVDSISYLEPESPLSSSSDESTDSQLSSNESFVVPTDPSSNPGTTGSSCVSPPIISIDSSPHVSPGSQSHTPHISPSSRPHTPTQYELVTPPPPTVDSPTISSQSKDSTSPMETQSSSSLKDLTKGLHQPTRTSPNSNPCSPLSHSRSPLRVSSEAHSPISHSRSPLSQLPLSFPHAGPSVLPPPAHTHLQGSSSHINPTPPPAHMPSQFPDANSDIDFDDFFSFFSRPMSTASAYYPPSLSYPVPGFSTDPSPSSSLPAFPGDRHSNYPPYNKSSR